MEVISKKEAKEKGLDFYFTGATLDVKKRKMEHIRAAKRKKFVKKALAQNAETQNITVSSKSLDVIDAAETAASRAYQIRKLSGLINRVIVHPNGYNLTGGNYSKKPKLI
jgi:predicted GIY-YIG superfamily endonuclease